METNYEKEIAKVADAINNSDSTEAAEALSQALLPMNHEDYKDFLKSVASKTKRFPEAKTLLELDLKHDMAHLWARSDLQLDYLAVMPGQNLSKICKHDIRQYTQEDVTQKAINNCVDQYAKLNKLADRNMIIAGSTLVVPTNG